MTIHHLLPSLSELEKDEEPTIYICKTCHMVIHYCFTNKELRHEFNTLNKLINSEKILKMINLYKYKTDDKVFTLKRLKSYQKKLKDNENESRKCK
jgi:hypothetical protein